jgi:H+/Cl- antiporter ClcA
LTWLSHGAGASVGREGVAVQLGRALSSTWGSLSLFQGPWRTEQGLFKCGVASGFAAIFGTPWAAVFFAFEISRIQQTEAPRTTVGERIRQSLPVFAAALLSDFFAKRLFGMSHSVFAVSSLGISWSTFAFVLTVAWAAALVGHLHEQMARGMRHIFCRWEKCHPVLAYAPSVVLMIVLSLSPFVLHRNLGTTLVDGVFNPQLNPWQPTAWEWWPKSFVTALSVAAGFRGGEVTPLFAIGVLLSQPLSFLFQVPSAWAAATGFASVFAVVMRAPWTGVFLSFELFGWESGAGGAVGCGLIALTVHLRKEGGFLSALLQRRQA